MTKEFINNMWVCVKEDGEKGKFRREEDADLFLKTEEEEDLYEDDGQPDEAQEWYDFDPDA
jgi:hypothetical protein